MDRSKTKVILALTILPFLITGIERLIIKPVISVFPLPDTSMYLAKVSTITLLLMVISAFRGNTYGLEISKKLRKVLTVMFMALIVISYFFLFSLRFKGFFDSLIVIHLVNLTIWPWQTVALQMLSCIPSGIILGLIREKTGNTLLTYLLHIFGDLLFFSFYVLIFGKLFFTLF